MTKKTAKSPDKLAKTGKASGVELTQSELGQARGGALPVKLNPTHK